MAAFLKKIGFFFVPLFLFLFFCQLTVDKGLRNNYTGYFYSWNKLFDGKINAEVLVLGSSRAKKHFVVTVMEKELKCSVFNLGMDGANIFMQQTIWYAYLHNNTNPRIIILEMDDSRLEKDKVVFNKVQFIPYLFQEEIFHSLRSVKGFSYADLLIPMYKYHDYEKLVWTGIKSLIKSRHDSLTEFNRGYEPLTGELKDTTEQKKIFRLNLQEVKNSLGLISKLYDSLKLRGIKLILVKTPKYKDGNLEIVNKIAVRKLVDEFILKNNIPYLNYCDGNFKNDTALFYDKEHLNYKGAELFTRILCKDLINMKGL